MHAYMHSNMHFVMYWLRLLHIASTARDSHLLPIANHVLRPDQICICVLVLQAVWAFIGTPILSEHPSDIAAVSW